MSRDVEEIAIIGMSGAFPGARNIRALWKMLREGGNGISDLSREELLASGVPSSVLNESEYVARGGFLDDTDYFDPAFFSLSEGDAEAMDPQQRLFLTHSFLALEDAGYDPSTLNVPVGVFGGESVPQYWFTRNNPPTNRTLESFRDMIGNEKDFLSTRVSYKLNLQGPSMTVQTACSTSLTATALACQNLLTWNCDMALAGGVTVTAPRKRGYHYYEGMIYSKTGVCRPFDAAADGTIFGEGVAVVCLKRLSDALQDGDFIYAVIKSSAINNDGSNKVGFTAPSVSGQAEAIELAQSLAGVSADDIGYVETHGTGTQLGDPIEIAALTKAFRKETTRCGYCLIGSLKANIGHLDAAAGVASLIKTALIVNTGIIPPLRNFNSPNPELNLSDSPFIINTECTEFPSLGPDRLAGVSSFGVGGTNVHIVLQSPPEQIRQNSPQSDNESSYTPIRLSTKNSPSLSGRKSDLLEFLAEEPGISLQELATKLDRQDHGFRYRWGTFVASREELVESLSEPSEPGEACTDVPRAVFLFPGQGSQFSGMAAAFYGRLRVFSQWIDKGVEEAKRLGQGDFDKYLLESGFDERITETEITQPLLYIVEYALAREFMDNGVQPAAVVGHSIGEYAAAAIAGVLSFEDGLAAVRERGRWMQRAPRGAMMAVALSSEELTPFLVPGASIAVFNAKGQVVVSGTQDALEALGLRLKETGIRNTRLKTSHAFHCDLMDEIVEPFAACLADIPFQAPKVPFISNLDGKPITDQIDWIQYWKNQLRQPVRFDLCAQTIAREGYDALIEVGPGRSLGSFLLDSGIPTDRILSVLPKNKLAVRYWGKAKVQLWAQGFSVRWPRNPDEGGLVLSPGYHFDVKNFSHENNLSNEETSISQPPLYRPSSENPDKKKERIRGLWRQILGIDDIPDDKSFFLMGGDSFAGIQLIQAMKEKLSISITRRDFFAHPTINALVSMLESPTASTQMDSCLFPISTGGKKPPLFLVAGAYENKYYDPKLATTSYEEDFFRYFSVLVRNLGVNQPLYGMKPKGLVLGELPHFSVEKMAEYYLRSIRTIQPHGPYWIGGECVGGIVAFEMAKQLEAIGESVGHLFLLDTVKPSTWVRIREGFFLFRSKFKTIIKQSIRASFHGDFLAIARQIRLSSKKIFPRFFPLTKELRDTRRVVYGSRFFQKTLFKYHPRRINCPVTLIVNKKWNIRWPMMGWSKELGPTFHLYQVPGGHDTRLTRSGDEIGKIIRATISE